MEYTGVKTGEHYAAASTMIVGSGNAAKTADVPRVSHEMATIQKMLAEHDELAETLGQRLHAVLRPAGGADAQGDMEDPRAASSPLSSDLESFRLQLSRLASRYQDILARLEI